MTGSMVTGWALTERGAEFARNHDGCQYGSEILLTGLTEEERRFSHGNEKEYRLMLRSGKSPEASITR